MKPLDIDGKKLRVGDCVEIVATEYIMVGQPAKNPTRPGDRFTIIGFTIDDFFYSGIGAMAADDDSWETTDLRLIPKDQKAPTKIEFIVKELMK